MHLKVNLFFLSINYLIRALLFPKVVFRCKGCHLQQLEGSSVSICHVKHVTIKVFLLFFIILHKFNVVVICSNLTNQLYTEINLSGDEDAHISHDAQLIE